MGAAGPNNGGTFANDATVGTIDWINPANAALSDNSYATCVVTKNSAISKYLKATNFGFNLPNSIINGILVEVELKASGGYIADYSARIVKGGIIQYGDDRWRSGQWPTTDTYENYGSSSDLWGVSWDYSDINNSGFGFVLSCYNTDADNDGTASIDHIRITVYYTVVLVIANASHTHSADASSPLVEHKTLAMADSAHSLNSDSIELIENILLVLADCNHTLLSDNLDLTQVHNLSIADGGHTLASDSLTLTQLHNLLISGCGHVLTSDVIVLLRTYWLSVRDGRHNLTSDSFVLGQEYYNWGTPRFALDDDGDWIYRKKQ